MSASRNHGLAPFCTAAEKIARLGAAGITVAEEISQIPDLVKERLGVTA